MAKISVNEEFVVNGKFTVSRFMDNEGNVRVEGSFASHYYFEEINKLEDYRYVVKDIEVQSEVFASDDFDIVYNFKAGSIDNKFGFSNLSTKEIEEIEKNIYREDGYVIKSSLDNNAKED